MRTRQIWTDALNPAPQDSFTDCGVLVETVAPRLPSDSDARRREGSSGEHGDRT